MSLQTFAANRIYFETQAFYDDDNDLFVTPRIAVGHTTSNDPDGGPNDLLFDLPLTVDEEMANYVNSFALDENLRAQIQLDLLKIAA